MVMNVFTGWAPQSVLDGVASMSFLKHFADISKGVIDLRDLVYFVLMIGFWLLANVLILDMKKAD
jgi:ABC-2 type transport system permease protein